MLEDRAIRQERAERTRRRIIDAGIALFSSEGYHQTSSKKIAKAAGVSVGSFYNYFPDKKALLMTIYQQHTGVVHEMVFESLSRHDFAAGTVGGRETARLIVGQALELHDLSPALHREMTVLRYIDDDFRRVVEAENERIVQMMVEVLSRSPALRVDDVEAAARVVISAVEEVVHSIKIFEAPIDEDRLTNALGDMIHRYLFA